MQKRIAFRGMESSPVLEEFANKHLEKVEKLLEHERTPIFIDLVLEASHVHAHHKVELRVKTPNYELVAHHEGPEMYQEIDRVTDKMIQEIRRAKERRVDEEKNKDSYKSA
jgi:ribosomal subunit interface protein